MYTENNHERVYIMY